MPHTIHFGLLDLELRSRRGFREQRRETRSFTNFGIRVSEALGFRVPGILGFRLLGLWGLGFFKCNSLLVYGFGVVGLRVFRV